MAATDKAVGMVMVLAAAMIFTYYTVWALILPFFPKDHIIHDYFLAREWAVRIPAFILVVGMSAVGAFVGSVIVKEGRKRRAKEALKAA